MKQYLAMKVHGLDEEEEDIMLLGKSDISFNKIRLQIENTILKCS